MKKLQSFSFTNTKIFDICWVIALGLIIIFVSSLLYENFNATGFSYDASLFISVAENLRQGNGFSYSFGIPVFLLDSVTGESIVRDDIESVLTEYPNILTAYAKPPLYFLLLALGYEIGSAEPSNWIYYSIIISVTLSISFITIYYAFCKKYFDRNTAFFASFLIVTSMMFIFFITTNRVNTLLWILIISSLFFIQPKIKNYLIFGIFAGLANLTHPSGIVLVISYSIFLLLKKEFKGFGIVVGVWLLVMMPWMIRLLNTFDDFGRSLSIPFSPTISNFLLHPQNEVTELVSEYGKFYFSFIPSPITQLNEIFLGENNLFQFVNFPIITFFIFFSIFSFLAFPYLKKNFNKNFIKFSIVLLIILISIYFIFDAITTNTSGVTNHLLEIFVVIAIPILIILGLTKKTNNQVFKNIPRIYYVISFFILISVVANYYSLHGTLELNYFLFFPLLFLALPLGLNGYKKITTHFFVNNSRKTKVIVLILMGLIIIPSSIIPLPEYINYLNNFTKIKEDISTLETYDWANKHISKNTVVASFQPSTFYLNTGNPTAIIPNEFLLFTAFDLRKAITYVNDYDIQYFILDNSQNTLSSEETVNDIDQIFKFLSFSKVYSCAEQCLIYERITKDSETPWIFSDRTITNGKHQNIISNIEKQQSEIFEKAEEERKKLESLIFEKAEEERKKLEEERKKLVEERERSIEVTKYFTQIQNIKNPCSDGFEDLLSCILTLENIVLIQKSKYIDDEKINELIKTKDETLNSLYSDLNLKKNQQLKKIEQAKELEKLNQNKEAFAIYNQLLELNKYNIQTHQGVIRTGQILDEELSIKRSYSSLYEIFDKKIIQSLSGVSPTEYDTIYSTTINSEINYWLQTSDLHDALRVYERILDKNKFDKDAWYGKATVLEELGRIPQAIHAYEFYSKLISEDEQKEIQSKILEVRSKITLDPDKSIQVEQDTGIVFEIFLYEAQKNILKSAFEYDFLKDQAREMYLDVLKSEIEFRQQKNQLNRVWSLYNEILSFDDTNVDAFYGKAETLVKLGHNDIAIETYELIMPHVSAEEIQSIRQIIGSLQYEQ